MATVAAKEESSSCQDAVPGCSTAGSPNDLHVDEGNCDGRKRVADCQLFILGKANEGSTEKDDSSLSGHISTEVGILNVNNAHSNSSEEVYTESNDMDGQKATVYICDHCNYKTSWFYDLKKHIERHTRKNYFKNESSSNNLSESNDMNGQKTTLYTCAHCNYKTSWFYDSKKHIERHNRENDFKFESSSNKLSESNTINGQKATSYTCAHCNYKTSWFYDLEKHMERHNREKFFKCESSSSNYSDSNDIDGQKATFYTCAHCNYKTSWFYDLKKHIERHNRENDFKCKSSSNNFSSDLKKNFESHTTKKPYSCKSCIYKCSKFSQFKEHQKIHPVEKPFSCTFCDYKCIDSCRLKKHLLTHEKRFLCEVCGFRCNDLAPLKRHIKKHTGSGKKHTSTGQELNICEICGFECNDLALLKRHIKRHTGEKPYSCTVCDHKFFEKRSLKRHLRTHTGEKPFTCVICDFKCFYKSSMKIHLRIHTGEKPYSCEFCDYKFSRLHYLTAHRRTHTGEKPYSCKLCSYRCAQTGSLQYHVRRYHKDK